MDIGSRIIRLREANDWTQHELSKRLKMSPSVLNRIELNTRQARDEEIYSLSLLFNVTTDYLLGRTDSPQPLQAPALPPSEQAFLKKYRTLTEEQKGMVENQIDYLCGLNEAAKQEDAS